jgi:hypothetical protein
MSLHACGKLETGAQTFAGTGTNTRGDDRAVGHALTICDVPVNEIHRLRMRMVTSHPTLRISLL